MQSRERRRTLASSSLLFLASFTVFGIPLFPVELHKSLYTYSFSAIFWAAVFCSERHRRTFLT